MNKIGDSLFCTGANEEIILAFVKASVEFIVIGGLAVAWHRSVREADDMDLVVNPTAENSARICQALGRLGLSGFDSTSFTKMGLQARLKQRHYAEILTPREGGPTYAELSQDAAQGKLFNIPVRIASIEALIRLKERAVASAELQRDKHLKDIELLKSGDI
jgi:hypothetical protein